MEGQESTVTFHTTGVSKLGGPLIVNLVIRKVFEQVRTNNLILRMPIPEDSPFVLSIEGDPATNRYRPSGPMKNLNEAEEKVEEWRKDWLTYGYGYWVAVWPPQSDVIGVGGIRRYHWRERDVLNLYYRFSPKAWGHGYATELARVAVQMARDHIPELPVVARIRSSNTPSIRVAEKIGLQHRPDLDTTEHMVFIKGWTN
ncbi:GNAT family N-acetyltransferase [Alicyclobacillus cycloheptanicus]|uniref:GNAT family N-acetyltransferase n=1 Tax=Alicyclobacillus cycloheptanicus TaxID=1457 RepID=UPI0023796FAF|nr:GNAT family N-acetyltransferase [Alicyclobacillus cycloheptanicus]